jgi:hypothetical protein
VSGHVASLELRPLGHLSHHRVAMPIRSSADPRVYLWACAIGCSPLRRKGGGLPAPRGLRRWIDALHPSGRGGRAEHPRRFPIALLERLASAERVDELVAMQRTVQPQSGSSGTSRPPMYPDAPVTRKRSGDGLHLTLARDRADDG